MEVQHQQWMVEGMQLNYHLIRYPGQMTMPASRQDEVVRLHFGMRGDYKFYHKQLDREFDLIGGHHNMMFSQGFDMEVYNKTLVVETFGIQFPKEAFICYTEKANDPLKRFCESMIKGESVLYAERWGSIDLNIQNVIDQIVRCPYHDGLKPLFLLSKSLELLVLSAEATAAASRNEPHFIKSKADKEKIIAARDILNEKLHHPPTLSELAQQVGLNEYKLKRGFKETFQATVFGYLTEHRLNLARRYLLDTQKTAAEVAFELGYSSPQHFNNAFKKKFGITPGALTQ